MLDLTALVALPALVALLAPAVPLLLAVQLALVVTAMLLLVATMPVVVSSAVPLVASTASATASVSVASAPSVVSTATVAVLLVASVSAAAVASTVAPLVAASLVVSWRLLLVVFSVPFSVVTATARVALSLIHMAATLAISSTATLVFPVPLAPLLLSPAISLVDRPVQAVSSVASTAPSMVSLAVLVSPTAALSMV